ncbi:MAG: hypothetical protein HC846_11475, partial [Blastocatellia bacterium]|nr:hypothetical protein [Blastocatellia bacterium]
RERWSRTDALGRMVEVVEPNPGGNGTMQAGSTMKTEYLYNTMGNLIETQQGEQRRYFKYDTLGRMTRQKLAEQSATIRDDGVFVGEGGGGAMWSSAVLEFDSRSNVIKSMDARGVKTTYSYQLNGGDDPLNRLQSVSYDKGGAYDPNAIPDASPINLSYMTFGDQDRIVQVGTWWTTETNSYNDPEGRISDYTITLPSGQPLTTSYAYDSLSRVTEVRYPVQYGVAGNPRKLVTANYDSASRMQELKVDNQIQMNGILYNSRNQVTEVVIGTGMATNNADVENYEYFEDTGLLKKQKSQQNTSYQSARFWNIITIEAGRESVNQTERKTGKPDS